MLDRITPSTAILLVTCIASYTVLRIAKIDVPQVLVDVVFVTGAIVLAQGDRLLKQLTTTKVTVTKEVTTSPPDPPEAA